MDRTKTKLATFFNNDEEEDSTIIPKPVDEQKLTQYTQGTVRKSKREKEREREEARKREEEELAAKTYAEYIDAFEGDGGQQRKGRGFIRAGGGDAPQYTPGYGTGSAYHPRDAARSNDGASKTLSGEDSSRAPSPGTARPKGKRAMDAFLEEIKRDQAEREQRLARSSKVQGRSVTALAAYEGQSGSKDRGDPLTSNVFVANLPANIGESVLGNFFAARCGPVGSVKIMWPRGDISHGPGGEMTASRSRRNAGLSGFVSFMKRKDAEIAVRDYDGYDWSGSVLRVGWSKAVPLAAKAAYVAPGRSYSSSRSRSRSSDRNDRHRRTRHRSRSRSYDRNRSQSPSPSRSRARKRSRRYSRSRTPSRSRSRYRRSRSRYRSRSRSYGWQRRHSRSRSYSPRRYRSDSPHEKNYTGVDPEMEKFIRTVALKVKDNGEKFEDLLRVRERQNSKFIFLFDTSTPEYRLYRALITGETLIQGFDDDGYNSIYSTDSAEESEREQVRKNKLGKLARRRFEAMLRALSGKCGELARCMAFCLEHAEAASEVSDIIVASLLVDSTPVPRKVARLHLICDILHNSAASVPNAWKFRQEFQARLGIVFDHLSSIYHSFPGRITADTFKKQIVAVVNVWEDWIVFPPEYIDTLKSRLEGSSNVTQLKGDLDGKAGQGAEDEEKRNEARNFAAKFKASSFKPATATPAAKSTEGEDDEETDMDMDDSDAEARAASGAVADEEDIDGVPIADDIDGVPIDDIDGEPIEDIDGVPMGDDIDGMPI